MDNRRTIGPRLCAGRAQFSIHVGHHVDGPVEHLYVSDEEQQRLLRSSTHFNPVDLVCAVRDAEGVGRVVVRRPDVEDEQ